jgi:hypothetical protein
MMNNKASGIIKVFDYGKRFCKGIGDNMGYIWENILLHFNLLI